MEADPEILVNEGNIDNERITKICLKNMFGFCYLEGNTSIVGTGLWLLPSFLNHSCSPNATYIIYGNYLFLRAYQDIKISQEICISYIPVLSSLTTRQQSLSYKWLFNCNCQRCLAQAKIPNDLMVKISALMQNITELYSKKDEYSRKTKEEKTQIVTLFHERVFALINELEKLLGDDMSVGIPGEIITSLLYIGKRMFVDILCNSSVIWDILNRALAYSDKLLDDQFFDLAGNIALIEMTLYPQIYETQYGIIWEFAKKNYGENKEVLNYEMDKLMKISATKQKQLEV